MRTEKHRAQRLTIYAFGTPHRLLRDISHVKTMMKQARQLPGSSGRLVFRDFSTFVDKAFPKITAKERERKKGITASSPLVFQDNRLFRFYFIAEQFL